MSEPLISIIVPVYGVEEYLNQCLESVVNQTYTNLEIILVDDGSKDNCPAMCDDWANKDSRIKVVHKENGGLSSARNAGLDIFTGEYVAFVDSDDWVDEKYCEILYKNLIDNNVDISVIGVWKAYEDRNEDTTKFFKERTISGEQALHDFLYMSPDLAGGTWDKLFKRELWMDLRFPEGLNAEDRYTHAVLYSKIDKLHFDPTPLYFYRYRENSICTSDVNPHTFDRIKVVEKAIDYLESINYSDQKALDYFKMKGYHDILYKLVSIKADKKYIKEYKKYTRKYWKKTIKNKEVPKGFKIKYTCSCVAPVMYERIKNIF